MLKTPKILNILELKIPPLVIFLAFATTMWLLAKAAPTATYTLPAKKLLALSIGAVGGVFAGAAIFSFIRANTTIHPSHPGKSTALVTSGVYAITRNPMYLAILLVLAGWATYLANLAALIVLPLFVAYLNRFQILPEERALTALFAEEFADYCKRVRRWL